MSIQFEIIISFFYKKKEAKTGDLRPSSSRGRLGDEEQIFEEDFILGDLKGEKESIGRNLSERIFPPNKKYPVDNSELHKDIITTREARRGSPSQAPPIAPLEN